MDQIYGSRLSLKTGPGPVKINSMKDASVHISVCTRKPRASVRHLYTVSCFTTVGFFIGRIFFDETNTVCSCKLQLGSGH